MYKGKCENCGADAMWVRTPNGKIRLVHGNFLKKCVDRQATAR